MSEARAPARFITLEGGEGVGKSTQARALAEALRARGIDVLETREPGGSEGAEAIRALLLDPAATWSPRAEALLFAAARADHVEKTIRPALAAGRWVVCDRFVDSSRAYQGGVEGLDDEDILELHRIGSERLLPDCTLLLSLDLAEAARREFARDGGNLDRIGGREAAFHRRVGSFFTRLPQIHPDRRLRVVDARGSPAEVTERLLLAIDA